MEVTEDSLRIQRDDYIFANVKNGGPSSWHMWCDKFISHKELRYRIISECTISVKIYKPTLSYRKNYNTIKLQ